MNTKYNMWLEKLDGTRVDCPADCQYPSQMQTWAQTTLNAIKNPEVYVFVWQHDKGEVRKKFYSPECWELDTFALEMFEDLCKNHDWYYAYSDDHRVYTAGREAEGRLNARYNWLCKKPIAASAKLIWDQYAKA